MRSPLTPSLAVFLGAVGLVVPFHTEEEPPDKEQNPLAELLCTLGDPNCAEEEPAPSS